MVEFFKKLKEKTVKKSVKKSVKKRSVLLTKETIIKDLANANDVFVVRGCVNDGWINYFSFFSMHISVMVLKLNEKETTNYEA